MDLHREAEAHLRTIRTLMERATVYRAVSAPTALVAGALGVGCGMIPASLLPAGGGGWDFKGLWLAALILTLAANGWFLRRAARRRGDRFRSPGMRLAIQAVAPPGLCGLVAGALCDPPLLPIVWMLCYGLALLATASFAPRSIVVLGWAFLATGLAAAAQPGRTPPAQESMALTFGAYHLAYALAIRRARTAEDAAAVTGAV